MEDSCLICLDENNLDTLLLCCNKYVHGSCIKQWWNLNNIPIEEATCPHCQQLVKIKKINTVTQNQDNFSTEELNLNIRPNIIFNLTNEEINLINNNPKNKIPKNMFYHNSTENEHLISNLCLKILIILIIIVAIVLLFIIIY